MNLFGRIGNTVIFTSDEFCVEGVDYKVMHQEPGYLALYIDAKMDVGRYQKIINEALAGVR